MQRSSPGKLGGPSIVKVACDGAPNLESASQRDANSASLLTHSVSGEHWRRSCRRVGAAEQRQVGSAPGSR